MFCKLFVITFCALLTLLCNASSRSSGPMKLIIDTDAGGDDAVAIFLALAAVKELQVIAITCSYGNTDEANVETNVLKILTVANRTDIPVYGGAKKPLIQNYTASDYFGKDGLGDFEFGSEILGAVDRTKIASIAMIELAHKYSGDLSILAIGPLTNLALAASLDPSFTETVSRFYVMGSTIDNPEHPAESPSIEFNFSLDPESNAIFFNSTTKLKTLVMPWDVALKNNITKEWRTQVLGKLGSNVMMFLNKVESANIERLTEWFSSDSITVATIAWPDLITSTLEASITPSTCGPYRGSVQVESDGLSGEGKNVEIIRDFNVMSFKDKLLKYLA